MIPVELAMLLRDAGVPWDPAPGDRFAIPNKEMDGEVFVLSHMTIEVHDLPTRTVIGFNGTTEWALDDVDKDAALWLPREDQLRELLGEAFLRFERGGAGYTVVITVAEQLLDFSATDPETAYALAVLDQARLGSLPVQAGRPPAGTNGRRPPAPDRRR